MKSLQEAQAMQYKRTVALGASNAYDEYRGLQEAQALQYKRTVAIGEARTAWQEWIDDPDALWDRAIEEWAVIKEFTVDRFVRDCANSEARQAWQAWIDLGPVLYMWYTEPIGRRFRHD